jgi:methionine transaminase
LTPVSIKSKLPRVGTTIFTVMSSLATKHEAVNLGQGFPDFPMHGELVNRVREAMENGFNQYVHMNGYIPLRQALAEKVQALYHTSVDPETQITVTPGGTYAIYTALTAALQPGDEVIVFEPAYDSYIPNIEINGAVPVLINLKFPDYSIDWEEVRRKITPRTRMLMLNTPHNPTGAVWSALDIEQLRALVKDTNIIIVSDEVYEHLIFDGMAHQSILRYPDLMERSFVCFSFGKVFHCTGWKLGYCIAAPALMAEFRKVHQFNCFSCNTPAQVGIARFLENKDVYLSLGGFLQKKRDYFMQLMKATPFTPLASHGSYFQCYTYECFSDEADADLAIRLTKEYGVATIPISAFYKNGNNDKVLRFCFAKKEATLELAAERLSRAR